MLGLFTALLGSVGILTTVFWVWMIYDCLRNERDRYTWVMILIFLNVIGALLYFFLCWLPRAHISAPQFANRWTRRDILWQAEADAKNIGNAHQYVKLGNILYDMGDRDRASVAYLYALEKEPKNLKALWGAASIELHNKNLEVAKSYLKAIVTLEQDFGYGDASLAYGQVMFELGELEAAAEYLKQHIKRWAHPEAYVVIAKIQQQQGNTRDARDTLETMIIKVKSLPRFQYRKNRKFVKQGERMLKTLTR